MSTMHHRFAALVYVAVTIGGVSLWTAVAHRWAYAAEPLRVCADPNNLPFSNQAGAGFENRIASLVGDELHRPVEYVWWAQRRGFVRNTLNTGDCDLVIGTVSGMEMLATTRPYYKSTYVFLTRHDRHLDVRSFDDSALRHVRIGVQLIGDDFANTPPVHALANRGIIKNVVGFPVYGDYAKANPSARIVDAVAKDDVDIAIVWGPLAGYFAKQSRVALDVVPVRPQMDLPYLPFVFDVAMGVRRADSTFRKQLDAIIVKRKSTIDSVLRAYGVPLVQIGVVGLKQSASPGANAPSSAHRGPSTPSLRSGTSG